MLAISVRIFYGRVASSTELRMNRTNNDCWVSTRWELGIQDLCSSERLFPTAGAAELHEVKFPDNPKVSEEGKRFLQACLTYDQALRPTIAQLCQNPYVLSTKLE